MTTTTKTRKTTRKPQRSATLSTLSNGKTILWITQDGSRRSYALTLLESDFGTAFHLSKADNGDGHCEEYDVLLHGQETSFTCPGHIYRDRCKHVEALEALMRNGKLTVPAAKPQPAAEPLLLDDL